MIDLTTLSDLIDLLNDKGVKVYEEPDLKLVLGGEPPALLLSKEVVDEPLQVVDKPRKLVKKGKLGRDGYTYDQQVETYGAAMDAEPDVYEE